LLVDSHAHIDVGRFDKDRDQVLSRAREAGVGAVVNVGSDLGSSRVSIKLAQRYEEVFAAVGFHPHRAAKMVDGDLDKLAELAQHPKVVAIGEIGLDFYRNLSPRAAQIEAFKGQLELAERLGLPVIIHSRNAQDEVLSILIDWVGNGKRDKPLGVLHCFSGDGKLAEKYIEMGFLVSIAGPVTYSSSNALEIAHDIPLEKLLIETDCPFLTPHPHRGKRNEPSYLSYIVEKIGEIRGVAPDLVADRTAENAIQLFALPVLLKGAR